MDSDDLYGFTQYLDEIVGSIETEKSYKAMLILSIIIEVDKGNIKEKFVLNQEIKKNFEYFYEKLKYPNPNIALPFYHIGITDKFWAFNWKKKLDRQLKTMNMISDYIAYATFNKLFYTILINYESRQEIVKYLFEMSTKLVIEKDPINKRNPNFKYVPPTNVYEIIRSTYNYLLKN